MIQFKINGTDISNDVITNTFNYMERIDDVYGTGSFQFESKTITENIPPYSILEVDGIKYCCSSEATFHYGRKSWFHNVSIIELTSLLSRFLVGSKAFSITGSNKSDYQKINILLELMNIKYNINLHFKNSINSLNKKIEFVFGAGTTLFDALNEILKNYNRRIKVVNIQNGDIELDLIDLSNLPVITTDNLSVLSKTKIQNSENYCKYLETEATNVIDTNKTTKITNIYPKALDIKLTEDTFVVETPTPIYEIKKFEVNLAGSLFVQIYLNDGVSTYVQKTYEEFANERPYLKTLFDNTFAKYYNWNWFKSKKWILNKHKFYPVEYRDLAGNYDTDGLLINIRKPLDYTDRILSKEQYDLKEDKDKPKYAYYTQGSKYIDGFNIFYKNDFWNTIIGQTEKPFIQTITFTEEGIFNDYTFSEGYFAYSFANYGGQVTKNTYSVEYTPIINPMLINVKKDTPINETAYKNYSLSYGKSGNNIDFDKLVNSMEIENNSIGKPEMVVDFIVSNDEIQMYGMIQFGGINWYVVNSQLSINANQKIVKYNLVSNYNKIADAISLNSQFNTLKNPLQNIIERPIYIEIDDSFELEEGKCYIGIKRMTAGQYLLKQPVVLTNGDEKILYIETLDQYSFDRYAEPIETGVYKLSDASYVNGNNEMHSFYLQIFKIENIDVDEVNLLPNFPVNSYHETLIKEKQFTIYKDAREKITFTIKAKNCIIK